MKKYFNYLGFLRFFRNHKSEFKVHCIGSTSRIVILVTRITHKLESSVRGRMADKVGMFVKTSITIFTQPELVRPTLRLALVLRKLNARLMRGCHIENSITNIKMEKTFQFIRIIKKKHHRLYFVLFHNHNHNHNHNHSLHL